MTSHSLAKVSPKEVGAAIGGGIGGALATILAWIIESAGADVPTAVVGAFAVVLGGVVAFVTSHLVSDPQRNG